MARALFAKQLEDLESQTDNIAKQITTENNMFDNRPSMKSHPDANNRYNSKTKHFLHY